jgi:alginate O-acetyltransferase complex protein AlgI
MALRESTYLVAAVTLVFVVIMPFAARLAFATRARYATASAPLLLVGWSLSLMLIIVYLRPISQFIYFQF